MAAVLAMVFSPVAAHAAPADLTAIPAAVPCSALLKADLSAIGGSGSKVNSAEETTSDGIAVCNVKGALAPKINFQVLLPVKTWTQRYLQVGCGGLCGMITLRSGASSGCTPLTNGEFVMAATDMGHSDPSGAWGLDEQQRNDFAYRAQHLTAEAAKALIAAYYGQDPRYSYFNGCSDGGREAVMEAMRFPDDFNGIIAGAPAMLFQVQNTLHHGWLARSNYDADGQVILTSKLLPLIHQAVLDACDANDGLVDGLIAQPALCQFDPQTLVGKGLTQEQADALAKIYAGPHDPQTGAPLTTGNPLYGSELGWQGVFVADNADSELFSQKIVEPVMRYLAFETAVPDAQLSDLKFTEATLNALRTRHPLFDATMTDLSAFQQDGGKLILWHGLADQHISPANTVSFHKGMIRDMGAETVDGFERLYLLPGVGHCGGGQGPAALDLLTPMMEWVETGSAPDGIMTASTDDTSTFGQPDGSVGDGGGHPQLADLGVAPLPAMTRPVYPYPATAEWSGKGEVTDGTTWHKGPAAEIVTLHDWPGADFFARYTPAD
ncbi:tannase/feruloyl esterase family alpha/beta hydrolase [Martelella sp. HB161492]|uniref:tannase/feruloyl esterase family alpha/beta hydrolase n=1 Tax=Martelella sp. HB161492 TaxID=2720726 RepID=UPI00158FFD00|nr:tannase/feruloyl esterase family alpha/beta hydrolase [Martelella sp. HB161492]